MKTRQPKINMMILDSRWSDFTKCSDVDLEAIFKSIVKILRRDFSKKAVSVVFMNDAEIQKLNKTYRNKDKPTNGLSFPSDEEDEWGDILLSYETVRAEAKEEGLPAFNHITHLIVHGFLHLLGYDHETDEQASKMETLEIRILKDLNIKNPYEDR